MAQKILLVDDDQDISNLIKGELERSGYQVQTLDGGEEVLGVMHAYKPDLLIMDVMLPGIDGYSLTNNIAEEDDLKDIPVIIMSALSTSRVMFEPLRQVYAFFSKPFSTEEFMATVKAALAKQP
jgi:DNA-binding response OmpR family regulator